MPDALCGRFCTVAAPHVDTVASEAEAGRQAAVATRLPGCSATASASQADTPSARCGEAAVIDDEAAASTTFVGLAAIIVGSSAAVNMSAATL